MESSGGTSAMTRPKQAMWKRVRVGDTLRLVNGSAFKPTDWTKDGLPIVRIQNLNNLDASFNLTTRELPEKFKLRGGELLFAWSGTPGTSFGAHIWRGGEAWLNQHIFNVLFDENEWDKKFLQFAINQNLADYIRAAHGGAGLAHITKGKFEESQLFQPTPVEQRRIVAEIEKQFTRLEAGVAALRRVQANLKRYRAGVLKAACEGQLVPTGAKWENAPFSDLIESSFYGPRFGKESYSSVGVPTIRTTDITFDGSITLTDAPRIKLSDGETEKYRLIHGDIVVTRTGATIGKCAIYDESRGQAIPSAYLIRFRFKKDLVYPKYVLRFLMSPAGQSLLVGGSTAVAQPNVNAATISKFVIPLPPLAEQTRIVAEVERRLSVVEELESVVSANLQRASSLRQSILQKAFSGELATGSVSD
jgi:type I restriction enzyme, S subunit